MNNIYVIVKQVINCPKKLILLIMSYDVKYRKRTIEYLREGHTQRETALVFDISRTTLQKWLKEGIEPLKSKKRVYEGRKIDSKELESYIMLYSDAYQSEIANHFNCTQQGVSYALKKLGYTRKKRHYAIKNKTLLE